jgi:hypothetical protein
MVHLALGENADKRVVEPIRRWHPSYHDAAARQS